MRRHGFSTMKSDEGCFIKREGKYVTIVPVHVDDVIVVSTKPGYTEEFQKLLSANFRIKVLGEVSRLLSMNVRREGNKMFIDQTDYVEKLLEKFGMSDCNPVG